jgi:bis(5'-nucleosyl)-tetraphosphatase (symmetrical)
MATYAIGDVQGCYDELQLLLKKIKYNPDRDQLWFAGDLVNRGPKSLDTLRFVKQHASACVLGNHDLHLLAGACHKKFRRRKDTLDAILNAPDRDELLFWLRHQPLLHHDSVSGFSMIHAGLPPQWDLQLAQRCAKEVENVLHSEDYPSFFEQMYGDQPNQWSDDLDGWNRLRFITNCFTRLRYCNQEGHLALDEKGSPGSQASDLQPWFSWQQRSSKDLKILFGHWSTLGAYEDDNVFALDTGCLWGGTLTALRLGEATTRIELDCPGAQKPGE